MGSVTVIGVGFRREQLTLGAVEVLKGGAQVMLHTARCGAAGFLDENGIGYTSLDRLYEEYEDFDEHAQAAADAVRAAATRGDVAYCVMDVRDMSAGILATRGARIIPGPASEDALMAFASGAAQLYAAADWEIMHPDADRCAIVREIDSRELACEVKLRLMEAYPDDAEAVTVSGDGDIRRIKLFDLDRQQGYDHRFSVMVSSEADIERRNDISFRSLVELARRSDAAYREGNADELAKNLARIAGAVAYAEDRGEFGAADIMLDARDILLNKL